MGLFVPTSGFDAASPGPIGGTTPSSGTFTTATINANGAASTPSVRVSGTVFTGGSASTTQPLVLVMPTGTSWTNGNTSGTLLGVNAVSGFAGNLLDLQTNNTRAFSVDRVGQVTFQTQTTGPSFYEGTGNTFYANSTVGGVQTKSTGFFGFSSTGNAFDTKDATISRSAASVVNVTALSGTTQALSGAGAVNLTTLTTKLTSTGAGDALTLANGVDGQIKTIIHDVDGGSSVLTPTTATGYTTITFTNVGESATLQYVTTRGWMILALRGAAAA